jgi:glycosyltransferase involved in cell wall biosynthesis
LLAVDEDELVILFLGRIDQVKGFPVLLPAFKRLLMSGIKARLLIVGPDSRGYGAKVRRMVDDLGLASNVQLQPAVVGEDKIGLMRAADCFVLPSLQENFGNAVVEAMQQGLPVVISNGVYICDSVERAGAGLVCNYDEREVFLALQRLAQGKELRSAMARAAIRLGREFLPEALSGEYVAFLTSCARPSPRSAMAD